MAGYWRGNYWNKLFGLLPCHKTLAMKPTQIINCHTHTFNRMAVPERFLPRWLMPFEWILENKGTSKFCFNLFSKLQRHELALLIKKFHAFLNIGDLKTQLEIFKYLQTFY